MALEVVATTKKMVGFLLDEDKLLLDEMVRKSPYEKSLLVGLPGMQ